MQHDGGSQPAWDAYWRSHPVTRSEEPRPFLRWLVSLISTTPRLSRLLDLGCGPGRDLCWRVHQGFDITGVDFSPTAIGRARSSLGTVARASASFTVVEQEVCQFFMDQEASGFDIVFAAATYQTLSTRSLDRVFTIILGVLHPRGFHAYSIRPPDHPLA